MKSLSKYILQAISYMGLALSIIPALLVFGGILSKEVYLWLMLVGMVLWFGTAIFWIRKDHQT